MKFGLHQQGPSEPRYILAEEDGRIVARFDEATAEQELMLLAAPELFEVCQRIIKRCGWGIGSRACYADGKGSLAGCSMSLEDITAAMAAIEKATGKPVDMTHAGPPKK